MGVRLTDDEAWAELAAAHTGILTTLRRDGRPVALPVWFAVLDRRIYVRTPAGTHKVGHVRHDPRATFLVERGERWAELCYGTGVTPALVADIRRTDGRVRAMFSRSIMRGDGADQKRSVENAHIPVAVIDGERDPIIRHSYAAGLNIPTLWDGHVHVLPGASHAAFRDAPEPSTHC